MRNFLLILTLVIIFVISAICGYYIYKDGSKLNNEIITEEFAKVTVENGVNISTPSMLTSSVEEKVSPNATLIIKKNFRGCGHTTKDYAEVPQEIVNMSEEEIKKQYSDWQLKGFSADEIVLLKEVAGICNEHFVLKEKDGVIAIFVEDENGNETLHEITEIATEYLTEQDKLNLKQGIKAIGKEELNSVLEDFE